MSYSRPETQRWSMRSHSKYPDSLPYSYFCFCFCFLSLCVCLWLSWILPMQFPMFRSTGYLIVNAVVRAATMFAHLL